MGEAWGADVPNGQNSTAIQMEMNSQWYFSLNTLVLDQQEGKEKWDLAPLPVRET